MKKIPFQLKIYGTFSTIGGVIGSIVGTFINFDSSTFYIASFLGVITGCFIGYYFSRTIKSIENISRAERFDLWAQKITFYLGGIIVIIGIIALILYGWNLTVFLSVLFFFMCTLVLFFIK
ncbi:MAG: hypothetical protein NT056_03630 [Proteobacteria bacterium]|nr:hypothetical protein [Pseudomonadota bacterium]